MSTVGNIASQATAQSQAQLQNEAGIRVAKKTNDAAKAQGDAVVQLLEQSAQLASQFSGEPHKGQLINVVA